MKVNTELIINRIQKYSILSFSKINMSNNN